MALPICSIWQLVWLLRAVVGYYAMQTSYNKLVIAWASLVPDAVIGTVVT